MKSLAFFVLLAAIPFSASAQQPVRQDSLLDQMTGRWTLQGTVAGQETTHDIEADWVLGHEYLRIHETSRETNAQGQAAYEAIVFLGWDTAASQYSCLWLDTTSGDGLDSTATLGRGKRSGDEIALLFKSKDGDFHTTFAYDKAGDSWKWIMDGEEGGKLVPFARAKLTRK
jgi:hypothetical protein